MEGKDIGKITYSQEATDTLLPQISGKQVPSVETSGSTWSDRPSSITSSQERTMDAQACLPASSPNRFTIWGPVSFPS